MMGYSAIASNVVLLAGEKPTVYLAYLFYIGYV